MLLMRRQLLAPFKLSSAVTTHPFGFNPSPLPRPETSLPGFGMDLGVTQGGGEREHSSVEMMRWGYLAVPTRSPTWSETWMTLRPLWIARSSSIQIWREPGTPVGGCEFIVASRRSRLNISLAPSASVRLTRR
jgi:hypothetical protein